MGERKVQLNKLQNSIWSDVQANRDKGIYNIGGYICLEENIDEEKLKDCAYIAITSDDALRMQLDENDEFYIPGCEDVDQQEELNESEEEILQDEAEETEESEVEIEQDETEETEESEVEVLQDETEEIEESEVETEQDKTEETEESEVETEQDETEETEESEVETEQDETEETEESEVEAEQHETEEAEEAEVETEQDETQESQEVSFDEEEIEEVKEEKIETLEFGNETKFFNDMKNRLGQSFIKPHSPLIKAWFVKSLGQNYLCIAAHSLVADENSIKQLFAEIMKLYKMDEAEIEKYVEDKKLSETAEASETADGVYSTEVSETADFEYSTDATESLDAEDNIKELCLESTFCEKKEELLDRVWIIKEHTDNTEADEYVWHIKHDVFTGIKNYEKEHELPAENIFMAALSAFINQVTGSNYLVVNKKLANRDDTNTSLIGKFSHELPLVLPVNEDNTFLELCENIAIENDKLQKLSVCNIEDILRECGYAESDRQFADIAIAFDKEEELDGICKGGVNEAFSGCRQIPLTINVCEKKDKFTVRMQYQKDAYEEYQIEQLSWALEYILRNACKRTVTVKDIVLGETNNLSKVSGKFDSREEFLLTVIEAFIERVDKNPYETAFIYEEDGQIKKMDYKIAGDCVCAVASYLQRNDVKRGDIVGIHMKNGVLMPLTMLATLLIEATILPIDIDGDENDNQKYYDMCKFVVEDEFCTGEGKEILEAKGQLDNVQEQCLFHSPKDIAYYVKKVCSSGEEKLVAISNNSLSVRLNWHSKLVGTKGVFIQKCKNIFDTAMLEMFYPCYVGATLYILPDGKQRDMDYIAGKIEELSITHIQFTPTMLEEFIESDNWEKIYSLKYLMLSDELINPVSLLTLKENRPSLKVFNLYGPVECTIDVTAYECNGNEKNIPLGNVADRCYIYIVNKDNKLVPKGYKGEVLIAGALLGEGYYQSEEEEGDFFTENGVRYFRTGDYGWVDDNGVLYYAGRKDSFIKTSDGEIMCKNFLENKALESRLIAHAMADMEDGKWVLYYQKKLNLEVSTNDSDLVVGTEATADEIETETQAGMSTILKPELTENVNADNTDENKDIKLEVNPKLETEDVEESSSKLEAEGLSEPSTGTETEGLSESSIGTDTEGLSESSTGTESKSSVDYEKEYGGKSTVVHSGGFSFDSDAKRSVDYEKEYGGKSTVVHSGGFSLGSDTQSSTGFSSGYDTGSYTGFSTEYDGEFSSGYGTEFSSGYDTEDLSGATLGFSTSDWFKDDLKSTAEETVKEEISQKATVEKEIVTEENVVEENVAKESVAEETAPEKTAPEKVAIEETLPEKTAPEETVTEETVTEETATEETVTEETVEQLLKNYLENLLPVYYLPSEYYEVEKFAIADSGRLDRRKMVNDRWAKLRAEQELEELERLRALEELEKLRELEELEKLRALEELEKLKELEESEEIEETEEVENEDIYEEEEEAKSDVTELIDIELDEQCVLYHKRDEANKLLIAIPYAGGKAENMKALIELYENSDILIPDLELIGKKVNENITEMYNYIYRFIAENVEKAEQEVTVLGYCVGSVFAMGLYEYLQNMNINVGDLVFCGSLPILSIDIQGETTTVWDYAPSSILGSVHKLLGMDKKMTKEDSELFKKEVHMAANLLSERENRVQVAKGHRLILIYGSRDKLTLSWNKRYKKWAQYISAKVSVKCIENRGHYELLDYKKD